jgi:hypothetical protein
MDMAVMMMIMAMDTIRKKERRREVKAKVKEKDTAKVTIVDMEKAMTADMVVTEANKGD